MLGPPLLRTTSTNLPVFGIARQLLPSVLVFAPLLAGRRTASTDTYCESGRLSGGRDAALRCLMNSRNVLTMGFRGLLLQQ